MAHEVGGLRWALAGGVEQRCRASEVDGAVMGNNEGENIYAEGIKTSSKWVMSQSRRRSEQEQHGQRINSTVGTDLARRLGCFCTVTRRLRRSVPSRWACTPDEETCPGGPVWSSGLGPKFLSLLSNYSFTFPKFKLEKPQTQSSWCPRIMKLGRIAA
jgi:hypothetical protein